MLIEQTIGQDLFHSLEIAIQSAAKSEDITVLMHIIENTLEIAFKRGQKNSAAVMQAAAVPLRGAGVKKITTVLITAGSVNKNGFVFTEGVLKKLEDPDKGIRFSNYLHALIKDETISPVNSDDLKGVDGFHVKSGIPSVIHADSASGAGVGRLIQIARDRERHRIARDLKSSSSQPPRLGYRPDPPRLDESNPPGGGSGVPVLDRDAPVLAVEEEQILPINITPTDLFAGLAMAALIIRDGTHYPKGGEEAASSEENLADMYTPWAAHIAKQLTEEIKNG